MLIVCAIVIVWASLITLVIGLCVSAKHGDAALVQQKPAFVLVAATDAEARHERVLELAPAAWR